LAILRIGTRQSPLALWQANHVHDRLCAHEPSLRVELVKIVTEGDRILDRRLTLVGGKGLFTKEIEQALLDGRADLAVHSTKDMTVDLPEGLQLAAIGEREDPRDAFVSNRYGSLAELPDGARVGTASLRRQCQLRATYPTLAIETLRGNVNTRLAKLDAGAYDAIILAMAGLKRLGFSDRIRAPIETNEILPAVGQGAICIECRSSDASTLDRVNVLDHAETRLCVTAERALNRALQGGCQVPIAAYATVQSDRLHLQALVGEPDGSRLLRAELDGTADDPEGLGIAVAQQLIAQGAREILAKVYGENGE